MVYQIDTNLYNRQVKTIKHNNFNLTLKQNNDLANNIMKEPYVFDLIERVMGYLSKRFLN